MALPPGFVDDLRNRVSLAQVVGRKVTWDPRKTRAARSDYWAPCPFHQEKTASFHVDDAKGFYHCFGCHAKGDAITFLRETENLGFMEAVELLAREAGMPMPDVDPAAAARAAAAQGLAEAMEAAVRFYRLQLSTARAAEARAYLDRRGLAETALDRFEIGYAPDGRTALLEHLKAKGFAIERLAEAGLVGLPRDGGSPYDRFRNRIMFPIRDARGRAIAFGARAVTKGQEPKYLNSAETPLFDKGRSLYNVGPARTAAAKSGALVVAEGYMDVIALVEAGIEHAVAPLGTAVTEAQLEAIWKLAPEPVVALDGDDAGIGAAHRLIALALPLLTPGRALRFAVMPTGQDPDDVIRDGGAAAMQAILDKSRPMVDLIWTRETEGHVFDSPERVAALRARLKAHVGQIQDAGLRHNYDREFRNRVRSLFTPPQRGDRRDAGSARRPPSSGVPAATRTPLAQPSPGPQAEARVRESAILAGCLNHPELADRFEDRLGRADFCCPDLAAVRDALVAALGPGAAATPLAARVAQLLGRDPLPGLMAPGQVAANRHLRPGGDPGLAARAITEELAKLEADAGRLAEIREAEREIPGPTDESLTWRLREAAEASHRAVSASLAASADADASAEAALSAELQAHIDREIWKRPKPR
jgi:DNA primase